MTRLLRWITLGALLGVLLLAAPPTARAADPMTGKWELNVRNSLFDPGPPPKSGTRTQAVGADAISITLDFVDADGQPRQVQYAAKFDGSDHPVTGAPSGNMISVKRIDARTLEYAVKDGNKTTISGKIRVSEDGSELEVSSKGKDAKGEEFSDLMVFDKR